MSVESVNTAAALKAGLSYVGIVGGLVAWIWGIVWAYNTSLSPLLSFPIVMAPAFLYVLWWVLVLVVGVPLYKLYTYFGGK